MLAASSYYLRIVMYRQTVIAPLLVFTGLVAALYASPAGPPVAAAAIPALALMPVTAWLARAVTTAETAAFAEITLASLGSHRARRTAQALAVLVIAVALTLVSSTWAAVANGPSDYDLTTISKILALSLAEAVAGCGCGLLASSLPPGRALLGLTGLVIASLAIPGLPPLSGVARLAAQSGATPWRAVVLAACAASFLGIAAAVISVTLDSRRGR